MIDRETPGHDLSTSMSHRILSVYASSPAAQPADQKNASRPSCLARFAMLGRTRFYCKCSKMRLSRKKREMVMWQQLSKTRHSRGSVPSTAQDTRARFLEPKIAHAILRRLHTWPRTFSEPCPSHVETRQCPLQEGRALAVLIA